MPRATTATAQSTRCALLQPRPAGRQGLGGGQVPSVRRAVGHHTPAEARKGRGSDRIRHAGLSPPRWEAISPQKINDKENHVIRHPGTTHVATPPTCSAGAKRGGGKNHAGSMKLRCQPGRSSESAHQGADGIKRRKATASYGQCAPPRRRQQRDIKAELPALADLAEPR